METIKKLTVLVLLAVWLFPGVSAAKPPSTPPLPPPAPAMVSLSAMGLTINTPSGGAGQGTEASQLAQREQQAPDLQNFKGGAVYVYLGSGALLVLIIILIILLL